MFFFHACIYSFWYSDQKVADEIIEREEVRNIMALRSKNLCFKYFKSDNTEHVNKIIQIFLKHNMMQNASEIIKMYLSYECWQKNKSAAAEIVRLCIELDIPLSNYQNNAFLNLILGRPSTAKKQQDDTTKKPEITKYKFKF